MSALRHGCRPNGRSYVVAGFFLTAGICRTSLANTPPPTLDESISQPDSAWHAASKPSAGLRMGGFNIKLEETTLRQVMSVTKLGTIQHQGDASGSVYWLCYTAYSDGKSARLWLEASGEMGGPENRITEINVHQSQNGIAPQDCPLLPKPFARLSFGNGVRLRSTKDTVTKVFHSGLLHSGNLAFIGYQGKVSDDGKCEGGYDLLNSLYITFESDVVVAINAGQVTSC